MKINNKTVTGEFFAYDNCHKIYILETQADIDEAKELNYSIINIENIEQYYNNSCPLRFINNWSLTETFAEQCKDALFEY